MCSITTNGTVDRILEELERSADRAMIERRLYEFAKDANKNQRGGLDQPHLIMTRMTDELRHIRKIRIGAHRIYFTGYHTQCTYGTWYIKANKRQGVDDEDDRRFQKILIRALSEPQMRTISEPKKPDESS